MSSSICVTRKRRASSRVLQHVENFQINVEPVPFRSCFMFVGNVQSCLVCLELCNIGPKLSFCRGKWVMYLAVQITLSDILDDAKLIVICFISQDAKTCKIRIVNRFTQQIDHRLFPQLTSSMLTSIHISFLN